MVDRDTTWADLENELDFNPRQTAAYFEALWAPRLATLIREVRQTAGISQTQLAESMRTSQPNLARVEGGAHLATVPTLARIADALGKQLVIGIASLDEIKNLNMSELRDQDRVVYEPFRQSTHDAVASKSIAERHRGDEKVMSALASTATERSVRVGELAPDFDLDTADGTVDFHRWLGDSWGILFSLPRDHIEVGATELGAYSQAKPEFDRRKTKLVGVTVGSGASRSSWATDVGGVEGRVLEFPVVDTLDSKVAERYGLTHPGTIDTDIGRVVLIIGPDKTVKLTLSYPPSTGQNVQEILRVLDSLQLTTAYRVVTPANWAEGGDVIIAPAVSDAEASRAFPKGFTVVKPYLRVTPQPNK
jgi:thioredoxin-dependent peroxiredoxin